MPGLSVYAATKAAVLSLVTSLQRRSCKKDKIRVHAVCPDGVDTAMVRGMESRRRRRRCWSPSGTFFQPEQVARELVDMFGTRRVYRTMPAWRGVLTRVTAPGARRRDAVEPVLRRVGRRKIRKGRFG